MANSYILLIIRLLALGIIKASPCHEYTMAFYESTDYNATLMQNEGTRHKSYPCLEAWMKRRQEGMIGR